MNRQPEVEGASAIVFCPLPDPLLCPLCAGRTRTTGIYNGTSRLQSFKRHMETGHKPGYEIKFACGACQYRPETDKAYIIKIVKDHVKAHHSELVSPLPLAPITDGSRAGANGVAPPRGRGGIGLGSSQSQPAQRQQRARRGRSSQAENSTRQYSTLGSTGDGQRSPNGDDGEGSSTGNGEGLPPGAVDSVRRARRSSRTCAAVGQTVAEVHAPVHHGYDTEDSASSVATGTERQRRTSSKGAADDAPVSLDDTESQPMESSTMLSSLGGSNSTSAWLRAPACYRHNTSDDTSDEDDEDDDASYVSATESPPPTTTVGGRDLESGVLAEVSQTLTQDLNCFLQRSGVSQARSDAGRMRSSGVNAEPESQTTPVRRDTCDTMPSLRLSTSTSSASPSSNNNSVMEITPQRGAVALEDGSFVVTGTVTAHSDIIPDSDEEDSPDEGQQHLQVDVLVGVGGEEEAGRRPEGTSSQTTPRSTLGDDDDHLNPGRTDAGENQVSVSGPTPNVRGGRGVRGRAGRARVARVLPEVPEIVLHPAAQAEVQPATRGNARLGERNASSQRAPSAEQQALMTACEAAGSAEELEEVALRVSTYLARFSEAEGGNQQPPRANPRRGRPPNRPDRANNVDNARANPRDPARIAEATRIQRLYRNNRKKAMQQVLQGTSPHCQIGREQVHQYFVGVHSNNHNTGCGVRDVFEQDPPTEVSCDALVRPLTETEVSKRLWRMSNTSPGPDGITYHQLRKADTGCRVLASIYCAVMRLETVPACWKKSNTVLVFKGGDAADISNWRPLSMGDTIYKLYTAIMADRVTGWAIANKRLSPSQKGFLQFEGCFEHNFVLREVLHDAEVKDKDVVAAWLDLANAFPSIPHDTILESLELHGLPLKVRNIVRSIYTEASTRIKTPTGFTAPVPILSGVKQGCPLSPILFNLALEPVLRRISRTGHGVTLRGSRISNLTYADDAVLLADSVESMNAMLSEAELAASLIGLRFNPRKCATLHAKGRKADAVRPTTFQLQGECVRVMGPGDQYRHLGIPTGYQVRQTPDVTIDEVVSDIERIHDSLLAPWQKIDAVATFILPRLDFILQGADVSKKPLADADRRLKSVVKEWMGLPLRASAEVVYLPPSKGGAGLLPLADMVDLLTVSHAFKIITCKDPAVAQTAVESLVEATSLRVKHPASMAECARFLSGDLDGTMRQFGDRSTYWSKARNAARRQITRLGLRWHWSEARAEFSLQCRSEGDRSVFVLPQSRDQTVRRLRFALVKYYEGTLLAKRDQGKVYDVICRSSGVSNHFMRSGGFTRFCDWRFIHRARLDVLPLNGANRWGVNVDKRCRICNYRLESLPHVLQHCGVHAAARQRRHNNIQNRLVQAIGVPDTVNVRVNQTVPGTVGDMALLRPDIVLTDDVSKKVLIVDVAVPFENGLESMIEARERKMDHYSPLAERLRELGYQVQLEAFIVGALGSWGRENERVLGLLGVKKRYAGLMRKLMVSDTIKWSRDIYVEHVSGLRQYRDE